MSTGAFRGGGGWLCKSRKCTETNEAQEPLTKQPENDRLQEFRELRLRAHEEVRHDVAERIRTNPHPTEEELLLGTFVEALEPQVRDAVMTFRRKGYDTDQSGFNGESDLHDHQMIDGFFALDQNTKDKLKSLGVTVEGEKIGRSYDTTVSFRPARPDLSEIKKTWDQIADALPDTGKHARADIAWGAAEFRSRYVAPEDRARVEEWLFAKSPGYSRRIRLI